MYLDTDFDFIGVAIIVGEKISPFLLCGSFCFVEEDRWTQDVKVQDNVIKKDNNKLRISLSVTLLATKV